MGKDVQGNTGKLWGWGNETDVEGCVSRGKETDHPEGHGEM